MYSSGSCSLRTYELHAFFSTSCVLIFFPNGIGQRVSSVRRSWHAVSRRFVSSFGHLAPRATMREKRTSRTSDTFSAFCMQSHSVSVKNPNTLEKSCIWFLGLRSFFSFFCFVVAAFSDSTTRDKSVSVNPTSAAVSIKSDATCALSAAVVELLAASLIAAAWISEKLAFEESGIPSKLLFVANNLVRTSTVRVSTAAASSCEGRGMARGPLRKRAARQRARARAKTARQRARDWRTAPCA